MTPSTTSNNTWPREVVRRAALALREIARPPRRMVPWWPWRSLALAAASSVALFGFLMIVVDAAAITRAHALPPTIVSVFRVISDLGKAGWFLYPLPVLMILLLLSPSGLPRRARATLAAVFARAGFLFMAIGIPYWLNSVVKQMIGRARPFVGGSANPYLYRPFSWGPEYASLPSNHATTVCAAAIAIGALWPRARPYLWIYAAIVIVSRIIVIAHHPSDVLAGGLLGACVALLVRNYFVARRLVLGVSAQGKVAPFAGPSWSRIKAAGRALVR